MKKGELFSRDGDDRKLIRKTEVAGEGFPLKNIYTLHYETS